MTKIDSVCRFLLPCLQPTTPPTPPTTENKKRLSTSLRENLNENTNQKTTLHHQESPSSSSSTSPTSLLPAPPRSSRKMVIGTIFGHRRGGHVWFCIQHNRLNTKPSLLLELSISTSTLIREMKCVLVRIALEFNVGGSVESELSRCPLHSIPAWTLFCNGRKVGFANRRKATRENRVMLKTMQNMTVGAGVIPHGCGFGSGFGSEEMMYMRANYEYVVGSSDSESFHLINLDEGSGQELSVFLIRDMLEGKAIVRETDMPDDMQSHAMELAYQALDLHEVSDCQSIAHYMKKNFDEFYGPTWHSVVGNDFGSCITHLCGSFIFFRVEMMEFLLFKDGKDLSKEVAVKIA